MARYRSVQVPPKSPLRWVGAPTRLGGETLRSHDPRFRSAAVLYSPAEVPLRNTTRVCQSPWPVNPIATARVTENPASSSAFVEEPPRLSPHHPHSPGVRYGKLSRDPSFQPFDPVNSQETQQLAERHSDPELQHYP